MWVELVWHVSVKYALHANNIAHLSASVVLLRSSGASRLQRPPFPLVFVSAVVESLAWRFTMPEMAVVACDATYLQLHEVDHPG